MSPEYQSGLGHGWQAWPPTSQPWLNVPEGHIKHDGSSGSIPGLAKPGRHALQSESSAAARIVVLVVPCGHLTHDELPISCLYLEVWLKKSKGQPESDGATYVLLGARRITRSKDWNHDAMGERYDDDDDDDRSAHQPCEHGLMPPVSASTVQPAARMQLSGPAAPVTAWVVLPLSDVL